MKRFTFNADWNCCTVNADEQGEWVQYEEAQTQISSLHNSTQYWQRKYNAVTKQLDRKEQVVEQLTAQLNELADAIFSGVDSIDHSTEPVLHLRDVDSLLRIVKLVTKRVWTHAHETDEED